MNNKHDANVRKSTLVNFQFPEVTLVRPECGDCTTIANSNEIPEFWEE